MFSSVCTADRLSYCVVCTGVGFDEDWELKLGMTTILNIAFENRLV